MNKQNISVDENYTADKVEFVMCNLFCKTPKTLLPKVTNCTFERCCLYGCEVDESNTLVKSNVIDTSYKEPEPTEDEARIAQLEKFIIDSKLVLPINIIKEVI